MTTPPTSAVEKPEMTPAKAKTLADAVIAVLATDVDLSIFEQNVLEETLAIAKRWL